MSVSTLIATCRPCQKKAQDSLNPISEFGIVLEWKGKTEAMKEIENTKCPDCGSDDWYFTDGVER